MPPPSALPSVRISVTTLKCSKANSLPVRPMPHCISSKIKSAPTSEQRLLNSLINSFDGIRTPASPWTVSIITPAVLVVICFRSGIALNSKNRTSGRSGRKASFFV